MTTKDLTQAQLDRLERRVCTGDLAINWNAPFWDEAMKLAGEIEENPFNLDSILLNIKKINGKIRIENAEGIIWRDNLRPLFAIPLYIVIMTRIYVLLYYCHRDDEKFIEAVINTLVGTIVMSSKRSLGRSLINDRIDRVIEDEKLLLSCMPQSQSEEASEEETKQSFHNNVIIELVTRLLEKAGMELTVVKSKTENYGNNAEAARLLNDITGIPIQTCNNILSSRGQGLPKARRNEVNQLNNRLEALGIDIRLETNSN